MESEDHLRPRIGQHAFPHHQLGSALFAFRRTFLGRLEDELHGAGDGVLHRGKDRRNTELHGDVDIVPARVHDTDVLSQIDRPFHRQERQVGGLGHRQRVHVGPDGDDRSRTPATQHSYYAGMGNPGIDLEAQLTEVLRYETRGLELAVAELGVLVDALPYLHDLGQYPLDRIGDTPVELLGPKRLRNRENGAQRQENSRHGQPIPF